MEATDKAGPASAYVGAAELYALLMSGYEPIGVVIGVSAISMGARGFGRSIRSLFTRGEMKALSDTAQTAKTLAVSRCEELGKERGADLVIIHRMESRDLAEVVEVSCYATALRRVGSPKPMPIATATN